MTTDTEATQETDAETGLTEPESRTRTWFRAGDPRTIEAARKGGRPRKGESLPEKLRASIDRRADKIIDGQLSAAERGNTRAFVAAMSYAYGVPATKLIVQREDDPLTQWLMGMAAIEAVNDLPALPPPEHG